MMSINPSLPVKSVAEFIAYAKANPGTINYASGGNGSSAHLSAELFRTMTGIQMNHVPYKGSTPALTDLIGGQVQVMIGNLPPMLPHVKAGKLRALAGWGDKRVAALPEVPTFKELGYPDAEFYIWAGVFAPRATPEPVLARLRDAMRQVVADPEFRAAMDKIETPITFKQGPEFQQFFDTDARRLADGVKRVGRVEAAK